MPMLHHPKPYRLSPLPFPPPQPPTVTQPSVPFEPLYSPALASPHLTVPHQAEDVPFESVVRYHHLQGEVKGIEQKSAIVRPTMYPSNHEASAPPQHVSARTYQRHSTLQQQQQQINMHDAGRESISPFKAVNPIVPSMNADLRNWRENTVAQLSRLPVLSALGHVGQRLAALVSSSSTYRANDGMLGYTKMTSPSTSHRSPLLSTSTSSSFLGAGQLRFVALCLAWYAASALTNNFGKALLSNYKYPVTLSHVQFAFVSICIYILSRSRSLFSLMPPTSLIILETIPLAVFLITGHVLSSVAISNIPVSFVHTIKALSPLFTVGLYRFALNTHYPTKIYISLIPLTVGVMLACASKVSFHLGGCLAALGSTLVFVCQNVYNKHMMRHTRIDRMNLLFYSSGLAWLLMIPLWFWTEGCYQFGVARIAETATRPLDTLTLNTLVLFMANGLTHFAQNLIAFSVLLQTSPVTYSIASLLKRIIVIVASILWFGEVVGLMQMIGISLAMYGVWLYQQAKDSSKSSISVEEEEGEEKAERGIVSMLHLSATSKFPTTLLSPRPSSGAAYPPDSGKTHQTTLHVDQDARRRLGSHQTS